MASTVEVERRDSAASRARACAVLQVTMLIAIFTIFVFGGAISKVAITLKVLEDDKSSKSAHDLLHSLDSRMSTFTSNSSSGGFGSGWKAVLETITHDSVDETGAVDRKGQRRSMARRGGASTSMMPGESINLGEGWEQSPAEEEMPSPEVPPKTPEAPPKRAWFDFTSGSKEPKLSKAQLTRGNSVSISSDDLFNSPREPFMV